MSCEVTRPSTLVALTVSVWLPGTLVFSVCPEATLLPRSSTAEQSVRPVGSAGCAQEKVGRSTDPKASFALLRRCLTDTVGGGSTVRDAGAGAALVPAEELAAAGASAKLPVWLGTTDTENVQLAAAFTEPPV